MVARECNRFSVKGCYEDLWYLRFPNDFKDELLKAVQRLWFTSVPNKKRLVWDSYKIDFQTGSIVRIPYGHSLMWSLKLLISVKCSQFRSMTHWQKHHITRPSASISLAQTKCIVVSRVVFEWHPWHSLSAMETIANRK